ncbi:MULTISPECIES: tyrosine-protein phosphatase [unclassified Microbacterium]|uniref:tyrosine-protein phosphatase n=1 Tax=unclassified Microbacterium TaxID=2609290 RepID=UPI000D56888A|nr:tyrosine-protein phosphatase [Microbacterium sp. Gd 4-13]PVW06167.1 protein-tyrosine-phosphatase [Microbacterium sp. Gd 4-13]
MSEAPPTLVSGVMNFRDVGGLPAEGGLTRSGVLYRSGNLADVDAAGAESLRGLGLRRILDLRDDEEVTRSPSRVDGLDLTTQRVPLFLGSVASFFRNDPSLGELYDSLIEDSADRVVEVVRSVLVDQPVLVHCTVGKDRTGVTVALTLAAAGVDLDAVVDDYARTETLLPASRNTQVIARLRAMHPEALHLEELATRSPAPVMRDLLARLEREYGSPSDYLRAQGLGDDEIAELRRILIVRPT